MVLMYADPHATQAMSTSERVEVFQRHSALHADLAATGELRNGAGLDYPWQTTTIRLDGDASAGPLVAGETQLTAYYVLECVNEERALDIARRVLDFHVTAVEVRRIHDVFGME